MCQAEIEMLNWVISTPHQGGPFIIDTHILQEPDGFWIKDNGFH